MGDPKLTAQLRQPEPDPEGLSAWAVLLLGALYVAAVLAAIHWLGVP